METKINQQFEERIPFKRMVRKSYGSDELIEKNLEIFKNQPTEENPYIIQSYPYGRLRTQMKVWVETVKKKGDRVCRQTLNPKTNLWNKPKKSTYDEVILMGIDLETGYIERVYTLTHWDGEEKYKKKIEFIQEKKINLNSLQQIQVKELNVIYKIREHLDFEFKPVQYRHKVTGEITTQIPIMKMSDYEEIGKEEREEKEKKQNVNLAKLNYLYSKEEGLI